MKRPPGLMRSMRPDLVQRAVPRGTRPPEPIPPLYSASANGLAELLGISADLNTIHPDDHNVTGLAPVQAGVEMVSDAVATMMVEAKQFDPNGEEMDVANIVKRPTTLYGSYEFYAGLVEIMMKRGNGIGVLADWDRSTGFPRQAVPAHPDACSLDDSTGLPVLTINNSEYGWDEVFHVRHGAPWGSLWGQGIIERYRNELQRQLAEQEWGRTSMTSGGVPSVVISLDKDTVSDDEAEAVWDRWQERHSGPVRKPAVVGRLLKVEPISWTPEDAEWVESRQVSVAQAALMCKLHPADLGASLGESMTYANLTDRQLSRVLQSFSPWMRRVEEAFSDLLPGGQYVRGDAEALLRTSTMERFKIYKIGKDIGIYTDEELRELERRPPSRHPETDSQEEVETDDDPAPSDDD